MLITRRWCLTVLTFGLLLAIYQPVAAKDDWIQVKSKNFFLIGNASEKDIRKVATRLEQFRETFRQVFGKMNLTSPVPTNVVVFKSESSYKNFKPKRADGKIDNFVAGYFQPGEDVNYITLSTEGEDAETFSVIFHEYVHSIIEANFGKSEVPAWFNEGLAEYYSTFAIEDDIKAKLGIPIGRHILRLQQSQFMPLKELFNLSNYQLHQTGDHSRSVFYSESWALLHYLLQNGKVDPLSKFLDLLLTDTEPEKAFQDAFQMNTAQMEGELRKYVTRTSYFHQEIKFKTKLLFEAEMQVSPLDEAASNTFLGDLLYHTNRVDDAEPFLLNALKLQPEHGMANITLGMVRIRQRKYAEAKQHLEKAIAGDPQNHLAFFRYAYLLSREGLDEFGYVRAFDKAEAAKMRSSLRKAIALNPAFTESYELLAFVDVVNLEELDDAVKMMRIALKYQPGNQRYALRLAEVLSRQDKLDEADTLAEKIARTSDDQEVKARAESLVAQIASHRSFNERKAAFQKQLESSGSNSGDGPPRITRRTDDRNPPTEAEIARRQADAILRSINESLRQPKATEQRVIGHIQKIDCRSRPIVFVVRTSDETLNVTSNDFDSLDLQAFDAASSNTQVGCDADLSALNAVVTYLPVSPPKGSSRGQIKAVEFVPADFRILSEAEMRPASTASDRDSGSAPPPPPRKADPNDGDVRRRAALMQAIKDALPKPTEGQKRELGYLDRIECTKDGMFFHLRTETQTLRLRALSPQSLQIMIFVKDLEGIQFGCQLKPIEFPAVFIYGNKPDPKAKTAGEIISLGFVPRSFVLDQ